MSLRGKSSSLTPAQQRLFDAMEFGRWYTADELAGGARSRAGTTKALRGLVARNLLEREIVGHQFYGAHRYRKRV